MTKQLRSWGKIPQVNWNRAKAMRRALTAIERNFWNTVRGRQLGVTFRRQHPIGPYVADFYAREIRLVVEIDGTTHTSPEQIEYDKRRDDFLRAQDIRVKRYTNLDICSTWQAVLEDLIKEIRSE